MTEQEMLKTWCPHVTVVDGPDPAFVFTNRGYAQKSDPTAFNCTGRRCSQWRWHAPKTKLPDGQSHTVTHGYCGLAGAP